MLPKLWNNFKHEQLQVFWEPYFAKDLFTSCSVSLKSREEAAVAAGGQKVIFQVRRSLRSLKLTRLPPVNMVNQKAVNGREVNGVNNIGDATNGHSPLPHVKNENEEAGNFLTL